ncbi:hypothetical protein [Sphingomonas sp. C3-2]|nr:hypothetical protein [Sphingomonas sp. C3-2]WOK37847.1 hypothetical protein QYC26_06580 [Sphingomonas sp. C3-2]
MSKQEEARAQRLAEALRQNLKRRKAQARGDETTPAEKETPESKD